ncbi:hypothetical protein DPMN_154136 [Dreissena polymorpha]|uniref:Uncharacterized protein n=1 Tax=Dreissena polymorpha TaxID=45954 RepID=A0A9D4FNM9_DREPO|nr:hypothetical protein DPMN_154136 [Dreissena polymorpha]
MFVVDSKCLNKTILTKFHEDWTQNLTSRDLTRKTASPLGSHIFRRTTTLFKLGKTIKSTNAIQGILPRPFGGHVFRRTGTIFALNLDIIKTNVSKNFELDKDKYWTINVASRLFTR